MEYRALAVLVGLAAADPDERRTVPLEREVLDVEARHLRDAQQGVGGDADERRVAHAPRVAAGLRAFAHAVGVLPEQSAGLTAAATIGLAPVPL